MFSKACEYGIKASIYVAGQSMQNKRASLKAIAEEINSPVAFTAKILQQLAKSNILVSTKGPSGGFEISKDRIKDVKLSSIVSAIDGDSIFNGCGLGMETCSEVKPCPVHFKFKEIRENLKKMMEATTLYELSLGIKEGFTYLRH